MEHILLLPLFSCQCRVKKVKDSATYIVEGEFSKSSGLGVIGTQRTWLDYSRTVKLLANISAHGNTHTQRSYCAMATD